MSRRNKSQEKTDASDHLPRYRAGHVLAAPGAAQDYDIDWWSVDGEMFADGGDWQLSGMLGQWDGSESQDLTGGFWPVTVDETDRLFSDGF